MRNLQVQPSKPFARSFLPKLLKSWEKDFCLTTGFSNSNFSRSICSGIARRDEAPVLLLESELNDATSMKKSNDIGSKRYLIFDQNCCGSRRIFFHSHDHEILSTLGFRCNNFEGNGEKSIRKSNSESVSFHETVAAGIAAFENAKDARSSLSPYIALLPFGPPCTPADDHLHFVKDGDSDKFNLSDSDINVPCYGREDTQELDALLNSEDEDEDEDEDEVTSAATLSDGAYETGYCSARLNSNFWNENPRKRMRCGEAMQIEENRTQIEPALEQPETESIKKKMKVLESIVGGRRMTTAALLDEAIHFVKNLQHQMRNLL